MKKIKQTRTTRDKKETVSVVAPSRVQVRRVTVKPKGQAEVEIYPLVLQLVKKCYKGLAEEGRLEYQDLISEGLLAVQQCLKRYKPEVKGKPVKFITFAFFRIVGALRDAVKQQDKFGVRAQLVAGEDMDSQISVANPLEMDISNRKLFLKVISIIEKKLPPKQATVLVRAYLEDLSDREIAKELGIKRADVEALRLQALNRVRAHMPADRKEFGTWVG